MARALPFSRPVISTESREGGIALVARIQSPNPSTSTAPYRIYNIGNNNTVELGRFIEVLEECLGKKAVKNMLPMQPGDVAATYADVDDLIADTGFRPATTVEEGVAAFVAWYREYYGA